MKVKICLVCEMTPSEVDVKYYVLVLLKLKHKQNLILECYNM